MSAEQAAEAAARRSELVEKLADVDEQLGELFLMEEPIDESTLRGAIRRATISLAFVPIFMGSAYKNKGVQLLLDGVTDYLPSPHEADNTALVCREGMFVVCIGWIAATLFTHVGQCLLPKLMEGCGQKWLQIPLSATLGCADRHLFSPECGCRISCLLKCVTGRRKTG